MNPPLTLYLVEAHQEVRELLTPRPGTNRDYQVIGQTTEGSRVLEACRTLKPQMLLLELGLPGRSGFQVARDVVRELPQTSVLFLTSPGETATVRQVMESGARGMVEKNAPVETLIEAIDAVGAGRTFFGEAVTQALHQSLREPVSPEAAIILTGREREVLQLVAAGKSNKEISTLLSISIRTAENHRHNIMRKLDAHNGADLTRAAFRLGLMR